MRAFLLLAAACGLAACQSANTGYDDAAYNTNGAFNAPAGVSTSTLDSNRSAGVQASPSNSLSNANDFSSVASAVSIEDDAARIAANRANYQVVQPTALPQHGDTGPNIVQYALNAPNVKGQEWYSRFKFASTSRFQRNCASYRSPDEAQRDFLARGGPERDGRGLDPDGDGFACGWDPAPFRLAAQGG